MKNINTKNIISLLLVICLCFGIVGCGSSDNSDTQESAVNETEDTSSDSGKESGTEEAEVLNIAYQYGLAYAPLIVMQKQELIEKYYEEATGKSVTVNWNQMNAGADINTGIASGDIDAGFMGVAPALTGISKKANYKIFTNLSGQEHGMMTNKEDIKTLEDLVESDEQIALVNIGSIQHIILARALVENGLDAHALDAQLVAMKHPDGMTSLTSGNIACHLTTNPYIYKEREAGNLSEISEISDTWTNENSFIVGVASTSLHDEKAELYDALSKAVEEAVSYINEDMEAAAKLTYELDGNTEEDELKYMELGSYSVETKGVFELAKFMAENNFIESAPESYEELVYDNVKGD